MNKLNDSKKNHHDFFKINKAQDMITNHHTISYALDDCSNMIKIFENHIYDDL